MHVQYLYTFIFGCPGAPQFLFAPNAQVEQMWSQAKYILSQQRSRMSPRLFETILYLKINDRFWDNNTVQEAISMAAAQDAYLFIYLIVVARGSQRSWSKKTYTFNA